MPAAGDAVGSLIPGHVGTVTAASKGIGTESPLARAPHGIRTLTENECRGRLAEIVATQRPTIRSGRYRVNATVTDLIFNAFTLAFSDQRTVRESWIRISHGIGSLLPDSLLVMSVQQVGIIDILLRSLEKERETLVFERKRNETDTRLEFHYQCILSQNWVCSVYEIFRLLQRKKLIRGNAEFDALAHDLRLLRIPFDKHEIAADRKLSSPLTFQSIPSPLQETKYYRYDPDDLMRGYDALLGVSANGSTMWNTVDGTTGETKWLERLALSDRIFSVFESYSRNGGPGSVQP